MFIPFISYNSMTALDATILKINTDSYFAGRLGRRIEQSLECKTSDGRIVTIKLPVYHTRFGPPKQTFKVGQKI